MIATEHGRYKLTCVWWLAYLAFSPFSYDSRWYWRMEEMEYPAWNGRMLHISEIILAGKVGALLEMDWEMA